MSKVCMGELWKRAFSIAFLKWIVKTAERVFINRLIPTKQKKEKEILCL